jgi:hypothetical protein
MFITTEHAMEHLEQFEPVYSLNDFWLKKTVECWTAFAFPALYFAKYL